MVNKARTSAFDAGSVSASKLTAPVDIPKITSITYSGNATATPPAGGETITVNGSFFKPGCYVYVDRTQASVVSFISSTQITFVAPAKSAGTYTLYVYNPDGGTAIYIPGMNYSGTPTWSTASGSIGTAYETVELSSNVTVLSASSDSTIKYRLYSGSLPTNAVLNTNTGAITGVTGTVSGVTTYTFVIEAYDLENQGVLRTFSITINPDTVTWSSPADGTLYNANVGSVFTQSLSAVAAIGGRSVTYTANTLPGGLSISGSNITGTLSSQANTTSLITATAATSNKTATRTLLFYIKTVPGQPTIGTATQTGVTTATVSFTAPAYDGNSPITSYIATSSPGGVTGTLNQAGSGTISISGLTGSTSYTFTVKANNAAGQSIASTSSNQITTQTAAPTSVDYLVVAGGGGGGGAGTVGNSEGAGGGGAGGFRTGTLSVSGSTSYTVTVGGGGTAGTAGGNNNGGKGNDSVFSSITSTGGGYGGGSQTSGGSGGSGGGGGPGPGGSSAGAGNTPSTSPSQGNNGGAGTNSAWSGSGGGAGASGTNASALNNAGQRADGGIGSQSSITGSAVYYAGGGGSGSYFTYSSGGAGGAGGGGSGGAISPSTSAVQGTNNLGGGGGGAGGGAAGAVGGSGVVIIAYPNTFPALTSISGGLTYDQPTRSGYRVYRFTAGTGIISW